MYTFCPYCFSKLTILSPTGIAVCDSCHNYARVYRDCVEWNYWKNKIEIEIFDTKKERDKNLRKFFSKFPLFYKILFRILSFLDIYENRL